MGKNNNKDVHTMIGADAVIQGNITCQDGVAVYGKVYGDVTSEGPVRIARGGEIHGNIQASDSQIGGNVDGNVKVEDRAVLGAESNLKGDLVYRKLVIEEGAQFQGHCVLAGNEPAPGQVVEQSTESEASEANSDHHYD
jgi:cytoskeletal protein CcmA (bactofilin family)